MRTGTLWRYTAAQMRRRPGRTLLTLAGIVIGVAAALAIAVTVQSTRGAHRDMFESVAGRAALEVVAEGLGGFDGSVRDTLLNTPGVRAVVPVIQMTAAVFGKSGAIPILVLGIDPTLDDAARSIHVRRGRGLESAAGVLMTDSFAQSQGMALGQSIRFLTPSGIAELSIAGLVDATGVAGFNGGAVAFMTLTSAQQHFGMLGKVNSLQLVLNDDRELPTVEAAVGRRIPTGLTVQTPTARGAMGRAGMVSTEQGLASLTASSLVAGAFVILNSFLMNLGERRKQLAILRALGATRGQVTRLLLREAIVLGCAGTVLGLLVGAGLALVFREIMSQMLGGVALPDIQWTGQAFVMAAIVGPGMALAATFVPARRAGRRSPLEDLLHSGSSSADDPRRWPAYVGLLLVLAPFLFSMGVVNEWFNPALAVQFLAPFMASALVGSILVIPMLLTPMSRLSLWVLKPFLGAEAGLAMRQLGRRRVRTSLTAGVLLIAVMLSVGFGQSLLNNMRHIRDWFDHILYADYYVRGSWPDLSVAITTVTVPEALTDEIAGLDEVEHAGKFRYVLARAEGQPIVLLAWSMPKGRRIPLHLAEGDPTQVEEQFRNGEAVLGTPLAGRLQRKVGDTIALETPHGIRRIRIAATASEYTGGGMAIYLEWETARQYFDLNGVHTLTVIARPGATAALGAKLDEFCRRHGLLLQSNAAVRATFDEQTAGFLGFVWMLVALMFVVASLGMANTLTINVLEQTRELGLLRAMGMNQRQIRKLILAQALALCFIGLPLGTLLGCLLAFAMNAVSRPLVGQPVPFHLNATHVLGCVAAALIVAMLAALAPARRACRLQVVDALQYE